MEPTAEQYVEGGQGRLPERPVVGQNCPTGQIIGAEPPLFGQKWAFGHIIQVAIDVCPTLELYVPGSQAKQEYGEAWPTPDKEYLPEGHSVQIVCPF